MGWLGYWDRIRRSDVHICLDHVAFEKGSFTNRVRIRQRDGREMWLTIPVEKGKRIRGTRIAGSAWTRKHREALSQAYGWVPDYLQHNWVDLLDVLNHSLDECNPGVDTPTLSSSYLGADRLGVKSELVLNLCKEVGATQYLSGPQGRNYLNLPAFEKAGIEVLYHDFPTDGDWGLSAVHHLFTKRSVEWPHLELISAHCSQGSAAGAA